MKRIKSFKEYSNESLRDKMTPKSKEDVDKVIDKIFKDVPDLKIFNWKKFGFIPVSFQNRHTLYTFKFLSQDDIDWYLIIWKHNGSMELRTLPNKGNIIEKFQTNDEIEKYLEDKLKTNESIRDKMTPKKGAMEKIKNYYMDLADWLVADNNFDTQQDAMDFLQTDGVSESIEDMLGLGMDLDEVYCEITQFNLDEYLYSKGLPLKFAFEPKTKDDENIVGSDAYNREHHMFYYETPESKKIKDQRREQIRRHLNLD